MDCNMPGMDGFETTLKIREYLLSKRALQPIISAVTGHMEQLYIDQAILSGMNQVLSKPVNSLCLRDLLTEMEFPINKFKL
jgi:CheY-like chemotaxis protein